MDDSGNVPYPFFIFMVIFFTYMPGNLLRVQLAGGGGYYFQTWGMRVPKRTENDRKILL